MDSYQPFAPSFKAPAATNEPIKLAGSAPIEPKISAVETVQPTAKSGGFVGVLDVFIHQARDIHNICIYHKQDVYAKACLTTDPDSAVSTQTINGGGRNPVFNQSLRLNVQTVDSTLKCEIWMLSRVRNYLEDQLLGFALVPLADVVMASGKLAQEFSLSSTDLFHSPAGFVQLSLSYTGSSPDVMAISAPPKSLAIPENGQSIPSEYDKIEFPDLKVVNENKMMVSEYFGIPCNTLDSQNSVSMISEENDNCPDNEAGVRVVESFTIVNSPESVEVLQNETPLSSVSTEDCPNQKEKSTEGGETDTSSGATEKTVKQPPLVSINIEPDQSVVQQDIVDIYMKSMQQFTESLANMKLPTMDVENTSSSSSSSNSNGTENGGSGSSRNLEALKKASPRVFYGSRAFF